jgi:hypothetical protein
MNNEYYLIKCKNNDLYVMNFNNYKKTIELTSYIENTNKFEALFSSIDEAVKYINDINNSCIKEYNFRYVDDLNKEILDVELEVVVSFEFELELIMP